MLPGDAELSVRQTRALKRPTERLFRVVLLRRMLGLTCVMRHVLTARVLAQTEEGRRQCAARVCALRGLLWLLG